MKHYPELRLKISDAANAGISGLVLGYNNERILTGGFTISDDGLLSGPVAAALNRFIDDSVAAQCNDIRGRVGGVALAAGSSLLSTDGTSATQGTAYTVSVEDRAEAGTAQHGDILAERESMNAKAIAEGMESYIFSPKGRAEQVALLSQQDLEEISSAKAPLRAKRTTDDVRAIDPIASHELPMTGELAEIYGKTRVAAPEEAAIAKASQGAARDAVINNPFGSISAGIIDASREKARRSGQYTEEQLDAMFGVDAAAVWESMYSKAVSAVAKDERVTAHAVAVAEGCAVLDVTQISFIDDEQSTQQQPVADDELADAASGAHQHVAVINVDGMTDASGNSINAAGFKVVLDPGLPPYTVNVKMGDKVVGTCVIDPETSVNEAQNTVSLTGVATITDPEALAAISAQGIAPSMGYSMAGAKSDDGVTWKKDDSTHAITALIPKDECGSPELNKQWGNLMHTDRSGVGISVGSKKIGRSDVEVSVHGVSISADDISAQGASTPPDAVNTQGYPGFSIAAYAASQFRSDTGSLMGGRIQDLSHDGTLVGTVSTTADRTTSSKGLAVPGAGDWTFKDRNVADNFDQHVREQLPWYDLATGIVAHVGRSYLPQNGVMYDIGASTGNVTRCLSHEITSRKVEAISIDNSESMEANCRGLGAFVVADARTHSYRKFHFGVCFLTLMFLPVEDQRTLLDKLVKNIAEGGALLIFDKTEAANGYVGTVMQRLTLAGKMAQGASYEDVVKKELSLSGVQRPINPQALLTRHGAVEIFRFGEFAGWLIVN